MINFTFYLALVSQIMVTVYQDGTALVKEKRVFRLKKGIDTLIVRDIAAGIDPTSVSFKLKDAEVLEQNFGYDLLNTDKLLDKYLEKKVQVVIKNGRIIEGTLLSKESEHLIIKTKNGMEIVRRAEILNILLAQNISGLLTKPVLFWLVKAKRTGEVEGEVVYLTQGLSWHAEYVGIYNQSDSSLLFGGWTSIKNESGKTYKDAVLKLVAGKVHRVSERRPLPPYKKGEAVMAKPGFEEHAFFEYHIYKLKRRTTLKNLQEKQIMFVEPREVKVKKIYTFDGTPGIKVNLEFENTKKNHLGIPLPAGKVRIYQLDKDGQLEFAGEDRIEHVPEDEKVRLYVGNAFDLTGKYRLLSSREIAKGVREETREIVLKNHKEKPVKIIVIQRLYGNWEIVESNEKYVKKDAYTIEFYPQVPSKGMLKIYYQVRFYY